MAKTVLEKIIVAIRAVQDHRGASRQAIAKYLKAELACARPASPCEARPPRAPGVTSLP